MLIEEKPGYWAALLAGAYIALGAIYIAISTLIVSKLSESTRDLAEVELIKGMLFVLVTGLLLYFGVTILLKKIRHQSLELARQRASIMMLDQRASAGLLASSIGHDANNLLGAIKLSVNLMMRQEDDPKKQGTLRNIEKVVDQLVNLNRRLVNSGEAEQPGEMKEHCLHEETLRILELIDEHHPIKKLNIQFSGSHEATAELNSYLYTQVVMNLMTNVARHCGESANVHVDILDEDETVVLEVHDDGPGVPTEQRDKIFEPYVSTHAEGAGLGLASINAIMRLHKGKIHYKDSKLGGACFCLHFPKRATAEESKVI